MIDRDYRDAVNWSAYAIGKKTSSGRFKVRRIVWGRLLAREEKHTDEQIARAAVLIEDVRGQTVTVK